jgi:hypothetical protein
MARISKYKFDQDVTKDDFVIGTDSQTKVTKNFKLADVIELFYADKGIIDRIEEIETQFVLTNGEITQLNTSEVIFQQSDRRADFQFTTSTFAPSQEVLGNESLWYFDFTHNLDKYPSIMVTESGSPDQFCMVPVKYIDTNTVRVYFKSKTSGKVHAN